MFGIIAAMNTELDTLLEAMEIKESVKFSGITYHTGRLSGCECVAAVCGPGKVNAALCAQIMIDRFDVRRIINTGVAGALEPTLRQLDFVSATSFVQHDFDTTALGDPLGFVSGIGLIYLPCDEALSKALADAASTQGRVLSGTVATGDCFVADAERSATLRETFGAVACEMEGGAIAQVCCCAGIPFAAIRCMSDNAGGEAGESFAQFSVKAAARSAVTVIKTLAQYSSEQRKD